MGQALLPLALPRADRLHLGVLGTITSDPEERDPDQQDTRQAQEASKEPALEGFQAQHLNPEPTLEISREAIQDLLLVILQASGLVQVVRLLLPTLDILLVHHKEDTQARQSVPVVIQVVNQVIHQGPQEEDFHQAHHDLEVTHPLLLKEDSLDRL